MKGVESVAAELSPEISPTWSLEDNSAEWQFLKSVRICSCALSDVGAAARFGQFHLTNPAGTGLLAAVTGLHYSHEVDSNHLIRFSNTPVADLSTVGTIVARDNRWEFPTSTSPLSFTAENNPTAAASGFLLHIGGLLANTDFKFPVPVILTPGSTLLIGCSTVNVDVTCSVHWSERRLPELET